MTRAIFKDRPRLLIETGMTVSTTYVALYFRPIDGQRLTILWPEPWMLSTNDIGIEAWAAMGHPILPRKQLELDGETNMDNPFLASLNPTTCHTQPFDFNFYSSYIIVIQYQYIYWYINRSRLTSQ
jgi:hypothetical protein